MTSDSELFRDRNTLTSEGWKLTGNVFQKDNAEFWPLYEAKMFHHFDHRFGTYERQTKSQANQGKLPELDAMSHADAYLQSVPEFWVASKEVIGRLGDKIGKRWLLAFRDITGSEKQRTVISSVLPISAVGHTAPLIFSDRNRADELSCMFGSLCSFVMDYVARQKVAGTHLTYSYLKQLPVLPPERYAGLCHWSGDARTFKDWLLPRVLELTFTAWDLEAFAQDCGWSGPPFRWDEERRFLLRCELDAAFFHLYLGPETEWRQQPAALTQAFPTPRAAVAYILDTFPIVKRKDEAKFNGDYRTKRVILEIYDALATAMQTGQAYQTRLNPAPASLAVAHPWGWEDKPLELPAVLRVPLPESWQYVVNVMVELLWQAGGSLPWRVFRTATDLLSDRNRLARLAELHVGQVALDWLALNGDSFDATHRWDQLSGFCQQGKMRVVRRNDELIVELMSADGHVLFPHVRFDARLALTVVRSQPVAAPTPAEAKEERRVAELIPA